MHKWRVFLVLASSAAVGHVLLPAVQMGIAYLLISAAAVGAAALGVRAHRGARLAWSLLVAGTACLFAGDVLWWWFDVHNLEAFPSVADVFYLGGYPIYAAALLALVRHRTPGGDRASLIDATIIATGTGVLAWVFVMEPYVQDTTLTPLAQVVSLAYPLADVLLAAVAARLVFMRTRTTADHLLGLGLLAILAADIAFALQELGAGYTAGGATDVTWLLGYVLFGAAALHPSGARVPETVASADMTISRARMVGLAVASLVAPGVLATEALQGRMPSLLVIAGGSAVLFLLVLVRMEGLVRQVQGQAAELAGLASTDPLTGLANRRTWNLELLRVLDVARRNETPVCMALIDLDHFKRYNDEFGHLAGDELLQRAARRWLPHLRPGDLLARYGGEEFALLLPGIGASQAFQFIDRLRSEMIEGQSFSAGLAVWDRHEGVLALTERADQELYRAKTAGRGCTIMSSPESQPGSAPLAIR